MSEVEPVDVGALVEERGYVEPDRGVVEPGDDVLVVHADEIALRHCLKTSATTPSSTAAATWRCASAASIARVPNEDLAPADAIR